MALPAKRGRKSAADLKAAAIISARGALDPKRPPKNLDKAEKELWVEILTPLPRGWIKQQGKGSLIQLIRMRLRADVVARMLSVATTKKQLDTEEILKLMREERSYTDTIKMLETKLRLTPQAAHGKNATRANVPEDDDDAPWK